MRILLVEDDPDLSRQLKLALADAGYAVDHAPDGEEAQFLGETEPYDAVILDLGLPKVDGVSVLERWRREGMATPVLILTARGHSEDRIEGLSRGADDYMSKPFEPRELALRIDAILRRTGGKPLTPREIKLGPAVFDMERLELSKDGKPQRLTEAEAQLLKTLAIHAHAPVERMSLSPDTADITGRAVDVQVTRLRRKLEADPKNPRYLQTVRGVGYMLAPD